jgi:hypothetical protein
VTLWLEVPMPGAVLGVVKAKEPGTLAVPPVRLDEASVWPKVIAEAVGATLTVGVALFTTTFTEVKTVL